jgi:predicted helicase
MSDADEIRDLLELYCERIRETRRDPSHSPEKSLYRHFEEVLERIASILGKEVSLIQEYNEEGIGSPDIGVNLPGGSMSYVEAKRPSNSLSGFTGRERDQFKRYQRLDNLIYTNFWRLKLFQRGDLVETAELVPSASLDPRGANSLPTGFDVGPALDLIRQFLSYESPSIHTASDLAERLARGAWLVRDAVNSAMLDLEEESPLHQIYGEYRDILFSDLSYSEFADAYAQTLSYGLLLARRETNDELRMNTAPSFVKEQENTLLAATLRLLSLDVVTDLVGWTTENLLTIVNSVEANLLQAEDEDRDPLLYFYEDFLEAYDPQLRRETGVYYTPQPVVNLQTRVINHLLQNRFDRRYGFADRDVHTLDPAVGTGTYLISALRQAADRLEEAKGEDSVPDEIGEVAERMNGFEILVGPYSVSHFRLTTAVEKLGGEVEEKLPIMLTDTLKPAEEQPDLTPAFGFMSEPITKERERADQVKRHEPIMVILGNPPYKRGKADEGWVWNNLLETFRDPVRDEYSGDFKNMADLYVSFYRWARWKLFESEGAPERGVLSLITNRKWLQGGWAGGMRQVFRQDFDDIYILDLHGDNRAPLPANVDQDENIFNVQVGVAIAVMVADGSRNREEAQVHYTSRRGGEQSKRDWLDSIGADWSETDFTEVETEGTSPFLPGLSEQFESWPVLEGDVFDFRHSGIETKRDPLVVSPSREDLKKKIKNFLSLEDEDKKRKMFSETEQRKIGRVDNHSFSEKNISKYGYRPLDNEFIYNHEDFLDRRRPKLQRVWGDDNKCLFTLPEGHGGGPSVFLQNKIPDRHAYRGSYGGFAFPLWDNRRENGGQQSLMPNQYHNFNDELVQALSETWNGEETNAEELFAYVYAVLSAPSYSLQFSGDLAQSFPRVPFPRSADMYQKGVTLGEDLVELHSFANRYPADGSLSFHGQIEEIERADYLQANERVVLTDEGSGVESVSKEVWRYSVSGYDVLESWIERREGIDFDQQLSDDLLDVIWILQETVALSDELDDFLGRLLEGGALTRDDLNLSTEVET